MLKRVYIIHGWDGHPEEGWFPWLKKELEKNDFEVIIPQMPKPEEPRISDWIPFLKSLVDNPDENTYFIGHSMGCQTVARYLELLPANKIIGGAVFVAGFFNSLSGIEDEEIVHDVVNEWLKTPIDLNKVKLHLNKSVAIFSDDDPYVPIINQKEFSEILKSKIVVEHGQGHFSGSKGILKLPSVLASILDMTK